MVQKIVNFCVLLSVMGVGIAVQASDQQPCLDQIDNLKKRIEELNTNFGTCFERLKETQKLELVATNQVLDEYKEVCESAKKAVNAIDDIRTKITALQVNVAPFASSYKEESNKYNNMGDAEKGSEIIPLFTTSLTKTEPFIQLSDNVSKVTAALSSMQTEQVNNSRKEKLKKLLHSYKPLSYIATLGVLPGITSLLKMVVPAAVSWLPTISVVSAPYVMPAVAVGTLLWVARTWVRKSTIDDYNMSATNLMKKNVLWKLTKITVRDFADCTIKIGCVAGAAAGFVALSYMQKKQRGSLPLP